MNTDDIERANVQDEEIARANAVQHEGRAGALTDSLAEREKAQDIPPLTDAQLAERGVSSHGGATSWGNPRPVVHPHDSDRQVALRSALEMARNNSAPMTTQQLLQSAAAIEAWLRDGTQPATPAGG